MRPQSTPIQLPLFPPPSPTKRCSHCHSVTVLSDFYHDRSQADGHTCACKQCLKRPRAVPQPADATKTCRVCGTLKPLALFHRLKTARDGRSSLCAACHNARARAWAVAHPAAVRASFRRWADAHKAELHAYASQRRAANPEPFREQGRRRYRSNPAQAKARAILRQLHLRALGPRLRLSDIRLLYDVQRGRCIYCLADLGGTWDVDHMTSVACGGSNDLSNLALACESCNQRKYTRNAGQFLTWLVRQDRGQRAHAR